MNEKEKAIPKSISATPAWWEELEKVAHSLQMNRSQAVSFLVSLGIKRVSESDLFVNFPNDKNSGL